MANGPRTWLCLWGMIRCPTFIAQQIKLEGKPEIYSSVVAQNMETCPCEGDESEPFSFGADVNLDLLLQLSLLGNPCLRSSS